VAKKERKRAESLTKNTRIEPILVEIDDGMQKQRRKEYEAIGVSRFINHGAQCHMAR
jgi:hypothetical protein